MSFKSEAQRKKFNQMVKEGRLDTSVLDEWNKATGSKKLPERVAPKKKVEKQMKVRFVKVIK